VEAVQVKSRLRVLRAERGWTQADLAERLEVSRQTVNAVETEKYEPSLGLAFKVARLFGLAIEEVFDPDGVPAAGGQPARVADKSRSGG
jgi:putative transcriptional regulator